MRNIVPTIVTILVIAIFGAVGVYVLTEFQGQISINETAYPTAANTVSELFTKSYNAFGFLPLVSLLMVVVIVIGLVAWLGAVRGGG